MDNNDQHGGGQPSNDAGQSQGGVHQQLQALDVSFIRVLEDLIDVLIENGVVRMTDLPTEAQEKLNQRKRMRSKLRDALDLIDEDDDGTI